MVFQGEENKLRVNVILNIYRFKVKAFFGAFRASRASIALLLVYIIGFLPSVFGSSVMITNAIRQGVNLEIYTEIVAAVASGLMVLVILLALRGYTVFEYEQNFIFTSPIRPREFLVASILADLTSSLVFANPVFILYAVVVSWLNLSFSSASLMLLAILLFTFMIFFLKASLSIIKALYKKPWVNALIYIITVILLLPAISFFSSLPLKYSLMPYPSTFLARILIDGLHNRVTHLIDFFSLVFFFLLLTVLFVFFSGRNFFPVTTYVPFISPFDTTMRVQAIKMERSIKTFSKVGIFFTLNLESKSLLRFLMKKEIIRMMRDGSLFTVMLMYLIISFIMAVIGVSSPQGAHNPPPTFFLTFLLGTYSLIVPLMLISNWRFSDFESLWMPLSSCVDMRVIMRAILYDFILVSSIVPSALILILSVISSTNPLLPLILVISTSVIGCSVNLYVMIKFLGKKRRGTPSLFIGWASMLISVLLLAPTYILIASSSFMGLSNIIVNISSSIIILAYSALIMKYFERKIGKNVINIEI